MTTATIPALTAAEAVALSLHQDGDSDDSITALTGIESSDLHRLARLHGITAPRRTVPIAVIRQRLDTQWAVAR